MGLTAAMATALRLLERAGAEAIVRYGEGAACIYTREGSVTPVRFSTLDGLTARGHLTAEPFAGGCRWTIRPSEAK